MTPPSMEPGAPAEDGGIPLCVPWMGGREAEYINECIATNFVSSVGSFVTRFEREFATVVGGGYAVATNSGTSALHVALLVAGVEHDDEVLVSTLSFIAPANAIRYCGAWPVFIDAEAEHWQMNVALAEAFLREQCTRAANGAVVNRKTGRRVRAIVPVHILGHPVEMRELLRVAHEFGLPIVEDATESLGATYDGAPVGSHGLLSCFSFNGNKLITTGGGGMIVTKDRALADRARYLTTQAKDDAVEFVHGAVGFNYRLTNIQAAMGCAQLETLNFRIGEKRRIIERYRAELTGVAGLSMTTDAPRCHSANWMAAVKVDERQLGVGRRELVARFAAEKIQVRPLWQPLHRSPAMVGMHSVGGEVADGLNARVVCFPCSVGLTAGDQSRVIALISALAPTGVA